ncbi:MAG: ABC transporter transmembrane domain-containing protein [Cypionkella sp.]
MYRRGDNPPYHSGSDVAGAQHDSATSGRHDLCFAPRHGGVAERVNVMDGALEGSLARYIWRHTRRQQIWVLCIVLVSMIPYFLALDLPKRIVNGPLQGDGFPTPETTQTFLHIAFSLPFVGPVDIFPGVNLGRASTLFALSFVFLGLVVVNGLFKYYINTYKGRLGERLLRRIRFDLVDRVLRFPPATFKRIKSAEIASMVKDEVEPLGGFTGDSFVSPLLLGGQALTALAFIFMQSVLIGAITAALVLVQATLIPRLRKRLLILGRQRQLTAREFAGRVGEIVEGVGTIHAYDTSNLERADLSRRLGIIFQIRYDLYQWKFMVKFINSFLAQVTPFLFYSVGGYLTLKGQLDLGQLVAVIGAYKDLPGPMKDLIDWDQARQDVEVKYAQVVGAFTVNPMISPEVQSMSMVPHPTDLPPLTAINLTLADDSGSVLLHQVNLTLQATESVALVGKAAAGSEVFAEALGRQIWPSSGRITVGEQNLLEMPEAISGRAITYVAPEPFFFFGTLGDNLLYGLKHAPVGENQTDPARKEARQWDRIEAQRAGTPYMDLDCDWIDYASAGVSGPEELTKTVIEVLGAVELTEDVLTVAMRNVYDLSTRGNLTERIVEMRGALYAALDEAGLSGLIIPFDPNTYNEAATVGENLLFGNPTGDQFTGGEVRNNAHFRLLLVETGLHIALFEMGREIAANVIELFGDLPPDHPFFQRLTFMAAEDIPDYERILQRLDGRTLNDATEEERFALIALSFNYVEPQHRFGLLTDPLMARIVAFRHRLREGLPAELAGEIEFYDPARYMTSANMQANLLFGRISQRQANARERIYEVLGDLLHREGLYDRILTIGLDYHIGSGGRRLTSVQRQKLGLARALMRRSAYFVFNRPLSALDQRLEAQIVQNVLDRLGREYAKPGIVWVLSNAALAGLFDRVIVFESGAPVDDGPHATVADKSNAFKDLMSA